MGFKHFMAEFREMITPDLSAGSCVRFEIFVSKIKNIVGKKTFDQRISSTVLSSCAFPTLSLGQCVIRSSQHLSD